MILRKLYVHISQILYQRTDYTCMGEGVTFPQVHEKSRWHNKILFVPSFPHQAIPGQPFRNVLSSQNACKVLQQDFTHKQRQTRIQTGTRDREVKEICELKGIPLQIQMYPPNCDYSKGFPHEHLTPIGNLKAIKTTLVFFITLQCFYECDKTSLIIEKLFVLGFQSRKIICAIQNPKSSAGSG